MAQFVSLATIATVLGCGHKGLSQTTAPVAPAPDQASQVVPQSTPVAAPADPLSGHTFSAALPAVGAEGHSFNYNYVSNAVQPRITMFFDHGTLTVRGSCQFVRPAFLRLNIEAALDSAMEAALAQQVEAADLVFHYSATDSSLTYSGPINRPEAPVLLASGRLEFANGVRQLSAYCDMINVIQGNDRTIEPLRLGTSYSNLRYDFSRDLRESRELKFVFLHQRRVLRIDAPSTLNGSTYYSPWLTLTDSTDAPASAE